MGLAEHRQAFTELKNVGHPDNSPGQADFTEKTDICLIWTEENMTRKKSKFEGKHSDLTGAAIGAFFQVHKELGYGFSEKVYENALAFVLREQGLDVKLQVPI